MIAHRWADLLPSLSRLDGLPGLYQHHPLVPSSKEEGKPTALADQTPSSDEEGAGDGRKESRACITFHGTEKEEIR